MRKQQEIEKEKIKSKINESGRKYRADYQED